ncbi:hypothetical protein EV645_6526 [Kribbella rubisoli]|uniref:Contractile injection system tube protein N-terminal domain-containing protein n=1 Tax=Kribbella rubisoli TaxID=3075929 RepID=A0A4Q7WMV6_9ACTN|nr:hypothetical protein [Kribbella rubisoli]RZU11360.1 hypothetical protein EV645_6526 [Kribbella rubisoli]
MTAELVRATLQRLTRVPAGKKDAPALVRPDGDAISVQLNPATLKITRRNNVDRGGVTTGTQKAQHPAQEHATLAFDLEFDTSEQGANGEHVDVRQWTALVRQFVEPPKQKPTDASPAVRFTWGRLIFNGIVDQVTEDLDYFAPDGTALHAKVSLSISEQDFTFERMESGNGRRDQAAAKEPEQLNGAAPGQTGTRDPQNVVQAHEGESAQQLLARLGRDPSTWRAAMSGLESPLGLAAGAPVTIGPENASGLNGAVGSAAEQFAAAPTAATPDALAAALGDPSPGRVDPRTAGFALAAAGGLARAEQIVRAQTIDADIQNTAAGFAVPSGAFATAAPLDAPIDPRQLTYGRAVPLQRRAYPATASQASLGGSSAISARARSTELDVGPGAPPWQRLPNTAWPDQDCEQRGRDARTPILRWRPGGGAS